jgi:hypothetical protein
MTERPATSQLRRHEKYERLIAVTKDLSPLATAVAHPCDETALKAIKSVAGQAQILVVPDLEAGNMLVKNLTFLSGADAAGVVLGARALMTEKDMGPKEIERFLYNDCGLKGLSGLSNDVRDLLRSAEPKAKLALNYFVYRIALAAGMLAAAMRGIDGFVFTAGIGENAPAIREAVAERLEWVGLELDANANATARGDTRISREGSRIACYVIPTDEELMIARHTLRVLRAQAASTLKEKSA